MQKCYLLIAGVAVLAILCGCETIKGFGKDVQNTGDNIQDLVNRTYDE